MNRANCVGLGFAAADVLASLLIWAAGFEGSWGGLLIFFLALPFSFLSIVLSGYLGGAPAFVILNALWWFLLVKLFYCFRQR